MNKKIVGFAFQIFFLSSLSYADIRVDARDSARRSSLCSQLNDASIAFGQLSPPIPISSAALCCQWCGEDNLCAAAVFSNGNCTFYNSTDFVEKPGHVVLLPNATTPAPTLVPTPVPTPVPPSNGLLAAWSRAGGTYKDGTDQTARYSIWEGVVTDALTLMQWEQTGSTNGMSWSSVPNYCAARTTGGFSDWRAPNIGELQTLVDFTIALSAVSINAAAFPNTSTADFWSSNQDVGNAGNSWTVGFGSYGVSYWDTIATLDEVRCVRSKYPTPPAERYTVASSVVTDTVTGLIWQQHAPASTYTQSEGVAYCTNLNLGGFSSGWRLPTIKELATLVDYSVPQYSLMMDATAFAGEPASWFWSSTPLADTPAYAWNVHFDVGNVNDNYVSNILFVRCVR
ncbi:MAG: DUF1566 domain-containing protein [Myxococcaceae bacterium]